MPYACLFVIFICSIIRVCHIIRYRTIVSYICSRTAPYSAVHVRILVCLPAFTLAKLLLLENIISFLPQLPRLSANHLDLRNISPSFIFLANALFFPLPVLLCHFLRNAYRKIAFAQRIFKVKIIIVNRYRIFDFDTANEHQFHFTLPKF